MIEDVIHSCERIVWDCGNSNDSDTSNHWDTGRIQSTLGVYHAAENIEPGLRAKMDKRGEQQRR